MSISRRSFLKGAAAASLAVAASTVLAGCNNIPGVSGGAYVSGAKSGSIKVNDTANIDLAVTDVEAVDYNNTLALKVKATNGMKSTDMTVAADKSSGYVLAATIKVNGEDSLTNAKLNSASTLTKVEAGKTEEGILVFDTQLKNWDTAEVTLTLYNDSAAVGSPVVFKIKK